MYIHSFENFQFDYVIWSELFFRQDLESIPEGLANDEGETLEEIDLTHNRISYPFS